MTPVQGRHCDVCDKCIVTSRKKAIVDYKAYQKEVSWALALTNSIDSFQRQKKKRAYGYCRGISFNY